MAAYWIARSRILNPAAYKQYTDRVPDILKTFNAKVLTRGSLYETLEGPDYFQRYVVLEFDCMADARACFNSPEYQAAAAFRRSGAGEVQLTIAESGDKTPV
jgi:uncharacterized protein (DUF1330 family)